MLNDEYLNRIAYLDTLNKKPFDLLLELIEIECFSYDFSEKKSISADGTHISEILKKKYNLSISEFILDKWIFGNFDLENSKLVLKGCPEEISYKINCIKQKEEEFSQQMNGIRQNFMNFSLEKFNKKINREDARKIFDSYIYSAANALVLNKTNGVQPECYFIFREFLKELSTTDIDKLLLIENFGIANQIQDLILYDGGSNKKFLENCQIFLDTPILMKRLGYDGKSLHDNYADFLEALKKVGAKEYIFEHTFDEIWGILFNFKRSVALNILNAKGVGTFLEARREFSEVNKNGDTVLTLDKDLLRENIANLGIEFVDANDEDTLNSDYDAWDFDEDKFIEILKQESSSEDFFKSWMERDKKSVSAIHRMRSLEHIVKINDYKDGKYYLLIDNYILISALKKYYATEEFYPHKNELLLENTILFQLWQQTSDNRSVIHSLFRSKCFAMNVIDEGFRDKLYRNARRLEAYDSSLDVKDTIIDAPTVEGDIYADVIKNEKLLDETYISSTLKNKVSLEKQKIRDEIKQKDKKLEEERAASKSEISSQIRKFNQLIQKQTAEHEQDKNTAIEQTRSEERKVALERLAKNLQLHMNFWEKIKLFFKKKFDEQFDEKEYFYQKASLFLEDAL